MAKDSIFQPALEALAASPNGVFGPVSFQDYLRHHHLGRHDTAPSISIDHLEALPDSLRGADVMVFRLGSAEQAKTTQFALVRSGGPVGDFFLIDSEIYTERVGSTYLPSVSMRHLFAFQVLPDLTETSLVNLAIASGVLSEAIGIDGGKIPAAPARTQSTFSFGFRAHSNLPDTLMHRNGQVEVDAVFVENRNGKACLFVVEAKQGLGPPSLAKHKLVYPILAIARKVPRDMEIVPIYLRAFRGDDGIHFKIAECSFPDPRCGDSAINELQAVKTTYRVLPLWR
ncbi:MAG: hypothetical protein FJY95_18180 [Candidatus Handelsmanbacteria bacterium]|nr:hypothetical protein [Candidatus Handelsmanbacteria bacterium]